MRIFMADVIERIGTDQFQGQAEHSIYGMRLGYRSQGGFPLGQKASRVSEKEARGDDVQGFFAENGPSSVHFVSS